MGAPEGQQCRVPPPFDRCQKFHGSLPPPSSLRSILAAGLVAVAGRPGGRGAVRFLWWVGPGCCGGGALGEPRRGPSLVKVTGCTTKWRAPRYIFGSPWRLLCGCSCAHPLANIRDG